MSLILIVLIIVLLGGGGGLYGYRSGWGYGAGILPTVLIIVLIVYLLRGF